MMAGGKKAEVEDHDGIRRHDRTEVTRTRAAPRYRGLTISGEGCRWWRWLIDATAAPPPPQHFLPRFPFAAYIPRFLFLPALSHGHSSGFLAPFLLYPLYLSSPSKSVLQYTMYAPTERIAPSSLRYLSFALPLFLFSAFSPTTSFQPSRILATMYYARTNRATYIRPLRGVGATLFRARHPL